MVGTDKEHQVNGNTVLGRKTKWGIIEGKPVISATCMLEREAVHLTGFRNKLLECTEMYHIDFIIYSFQAKKNTSIVRF